MNEFPWAALLHLRSSKTNQEERCGGSLVSDRHVLTAAHCLKKLSSAGEIIDVWDETTVVLGEMKIIQIENNILNISQENTILRMALRRLLSNLR